MHTLTHILEWLVILWFGCGFIAALRGFLGGYGLFSFVFWTPLGPLGLLFQLFGNVG